MKTKNQILTLLLAASSIIFFVNCSGEKKETTEATTTEHEHAKHDPSSTAAMEVSKPQFETDAKFQQQLAGVFQSYVALKEAFVSSDVTKVKEQGKSVSSAIASTDMKLLTGVAHNDWMTYLGGMQTALGEIETSTDIEAQRKSFSTLSDNLYKSIKAFGLGGQEAFYEFCPMAFNNEGGYWLSDKDQIRNPYFGDKMLTCGSVKEKLN